MLQERFNPLGSVAGDPSLADNQTIDFDGMLAALRRQYIAILFGVVVALVIGATYYVTAVPKFTASADILLFSDSQQQLVSQLLAESGRVDDDAAVLSQMELVKSDGITDAVLAKLDLANDPRFNTPSGPGLLGSILGILHGGAEAALDPEEERRLLRDKLKSGLDVDRAGKANVLRVSYTSANPALAAAIAQGYADAYLDDQLDSKYDAIRRASSWLQDRIAELKQKSIDSDAAVQKFKSDHNLIDTAGTLLSDQQLIQLNSALMSAQAATSEAEAKYTHLQEVLNSGDVNAVVTDALADQAITDLRGKFLDASKRAQEIASRLGENHEQAVRARAEMEEYKRLILEEVGRIAQSYQSTYKVAKAQQASLEEQVAKATGVSNKASDAQVQLRELQREADTYRNLYQNFLQHYQEAVQQQSFPVNEARIISKADTPSKPSSPKGALVFGLSGAGGLVLGLAIAFMREHRDRYFRTGEQVRTELNEQLLGIVPEVEYGAVRADERRRKKRSRKRHEGTALIANAGLMTRFVVEQPMSLFAETMRSTKIAVDLSSRRDKGKMIGIISALPGEGKSVISMNFAGHLARQGRRTLLIDGDLRNPSTSRVLAPDVDKGLVEVLTDAHTSVSDVLRRDESTGLEVLPAVSSRQAVPYSSELLSSPAMDDLLAGASTYDYVIMDLPPLGLVVDARAMAAKLDGFIIVIEWGRTPRKLIKDLLRREFLVSEKCIGIILNKVDTHKLRLYSNEPTAEYYGKQGYFRTTKAPAEVA